jgi:hypothetical protein
MNHPPSCGSGRWWGLDKLKVKLKSKSKPKTKKKLLLLKLPPRLKEVQKLSPLGKCPQDNGAYNADLKRNN